MAKSDLQVKPPRIGPRPPTNGHTPPAPAGNGLNGQTPPTADGEGWETTPVPPGGEGGLLHPAARGRLIPQERPKVIKFSRVSKRFALHAARPKSFQDLLVGLMGRAGLHRPPAELAPAREFWALRDVNFSVYQGEALGIIGENGSGKSTTLKLISRILYPTSGTVNVKGKVSALLELGTGFHQDLTGRENIFLNGSLLGIGRRAMEGLYAQIVDFAELGQFIEQPIKWYSSGMVMRLGFAVAINVNPDILITDEVLAVGDEAFQRKCLEAIARIRREGKTIIYVSHALESVRGLCQRVIWLDHGQVRADGPSGTVIDQYLDYTNRRHRERLEARYAETQHPASPASDGSAPAPAAVPGERTANRWGNGLVRITDAQFLDGSDTVAQAFMTGEPFTIRVFYHAAERVEKPVFGLALYTGNGVHLTGPNTRFSGFDIPYVEGDGYVDYRVASLPLLSGVYDVTVAVVSTDMTEMYDHQHQWYHFVVQPNPALAERFGLVQLPGEWAAHATGVGG